jgi:predicted Fe-Mo cluster-binding NifX family protein
MKIAVAADNNMVTQHFGHCEYFIVFEVENKEKIGSEIVKNPPHQRGFLPKFLKDHGIDVLLTGNMGEMAKKLMKTLGIEVICGATGAASETVDKYLAGTLEVTDATCEHHHGEHHDHDHNHDHHHHNH